MMYRGINVKKKHKQLKNSVLAQLYLSHKRVASFEKLHKP